MKFEPGTLFISLTDLFSIMLPGALATALTKRAVEPLLFPAVFPQYTGETAGWVVFLFVSYLLGHFIFSFSSFLDDLVYEKLRHPDKDEEAALLNEITPLIDEMNKDGNIALLKEIAKRAQEAAGATKQEQQSMIEKIEKMAKQMRDNLKDTKECRPSATLDKLDKELRKYKKNRAKFFRRLIKWTLKRRLTKWALKQLFSETPDLAVNRVLEIKRGYVPDVNGKPVVNAFQWAKAHLAIKCTAASVEVQRLEANSKFFRSLVVVLLFLSGWLFWKAFKGNPNWLLFFSTGNVKSLPPPSEFKENPNWLLFFSCLVFSGLSFLRYVEQRFKAAQQAYWFVIALEGSLPPTASKH